jgi:phage shock protein C
VNQPVRRLYRSRHQAQLAGICVGLGTYLQMDPVVIRLLVLAVTIFTGVVPGVVTYLAAWIVVPQEPLPLPAATHVPPQSAPHSSV